MKKMIAKMFWFGSGLLMGATTLSIAMGAVPGKGRVTDDTVIYQNLSEIRVKREGHISFDKDIARLASLESKYRENLPAARDARIASPMKRISKQQYRFSGSKNTRVVKH